MSNRDLNPRVVVKTKTIDTWAAEALAAGTHYGPAVELPRGAVLASLTQEMTTLDGTSGDEDYLFFLQGRNSPDHSWVTLPGLSFTQITNQSPSGAVYERIPTAANAPGVTLPRYVRSGVTTAGTTPIVTGAIRMQYSAPNGPSKVVNHGAVS